MSRSSLRWHRRSAAGAIAVTTAGATALWLAFPPSAWALCPNCLGQNATWTPTLRLLGLFLVVPFVVFACVSLSIRRACRGARSPGDRAR